MVLSRILQLISFRILLVSVLSYPLVVLLCVVGIYGYQWNSAALKLATSFGVGYGFACIELYLLYRFVDYLFKRTVLRGAIGPGLMFVIVAKFILLTAVMFIAGLPAFDGTALVVGISGLPYLAVLLGIFTIRGKSKDCA